MNAKQKAEILKQNKYRHNQYHAHKHVWALGVHVVASDSSFAKATHAAYDHYLNSFLQAANDSAGKEAYEEVKAEAAEPRYVVGKRTNEYCWYVWDNEENEEASKNIWDEAECQKLADSMNANDPAQLRAEIEALKAENARLVAGNEGLRKLLAHVACEISGITENINPLKRDDFRAITSGIRKALQGTSAPTAQAASEVPAAMDKPVDEDMLYTQIDCPKCKGNCKFDFINDDGNEDYNLCRLCEYTGTVYLRDGKTYRFMRDDNGKYRYLQIPPAELMPYGKKAVPARMRVNWGRGFSSGSYPVLGFSQEKQVYILDISTDCNRAMPKPVRFADCREA